jgi:hypothetical protein
MNKYNKFKEKYNGFSCRRKKGFMLWTKFKQIYRSHNAFLYMQGFGFYENSSETLVKIVC